MDKKEDRLDAELVGFVGQGRSNGGEWYYGKIEDYIMGDTCI